MCPPPPLFSQHVHPVTAVSMSPSGSYIASGDASGLVRIWACDSPDQILKLETPMLGGKVNISSSPHIHIHVREISNSQMAMLYTLALQ